MAYTIGANEFEIESMRGAYLDLYRHYDILPVNLYDSAKVSEKADILYIIDPKLYIEKPAKKAMAKKPAPKTAKKLSAADTVLGFIKKSRSGINIEKLKEKSGFQGQKLHNAVYTLKKQGKIKSVKRPVKILAKGELSTALVIQADKFSDAARQKIVAAGGTAEERSA